MLYNQTPQGADALRIEKAQLRDTVSRIAVACLLFVLLQKLLGFAFGFVTLSSEIAAWWVQLAGEVFLYLPPILLLGFSLRDALPARLVFRAPNDGRVAALSVPILLGGTLTVSILINILSQMLDSAGLSPELPSYPEPQSGAGFVFYLLSMTIVPAFFEELLFRGLALRALRRFGDRVAIFLTALLFGLLHQNLLQFVNAFFLGLMLGYFAVRTDSLFTSILMHFFNNLVFTMIDAVVVLLPDTRTQLLCQIGIELALLLLAILAVLLLLRIDRKTPPPPLRHGRMRDGAQIAAGLTCGWMLLTLAYFVVRILLSIKPV